MPPAPPTNRAPLARPWAQRACPGVDRSLEVLHWGRPDGPTVVAVHGFLDHAWAWDGFIPALADRWHVISFSARGHGASEWADSYEWTEFVADLARVVEVEAGGRAHLLGHSWGGHLCTELARLAPDLVRSLTNVDGFEPAPRSRQPLDLATVVQVAADRAGARRVLSPRASRDDLVARRKVLTPRVPEDCVVSFVEHGSVEGPDGWRWCLDPLLVGPRPWETMRTQPFDILEATRSLPVPTLLVSGGAAEAPALMPDRSAAFLVAGEDHVRHVHVPEAGHYVHLEHPGPVAAAMDGLLGA